MSEVTIATRSRENAQPKRMQVSFDLRTFLRILTFLNLERIPLKAIYRYLFTNNHLLILLIHYLF